MKRGYKKTFLTLHPPITITYNHKSLCYEVKLRKQVPFHLEILIPNKSFEYCLNEKLIQGKDPKTAFIEILKDQPNSKLKINLNLNEFEKICTAVSEAMKNEHNIKIVIEPTI